jgi:hypothetical protein
MTISTNVIAYLSFLACQAIATLNIADHSAAMSKIVTGSHPHKQATFMLDLHRGCPKLLEKAKAHPETEGVRRHQSQAKKSTSLKQIGKGCH